MSMTVPPDDPARGSIVDEWQHGTSVAYQYRKCRCDLCRAWKAAYQRDYRQRKGGGATAIELLSTRAQSKALRALAERYPEQYAELLRDARLALSRDMGIVP